MCADRLYMKKGGMVPKVQTADCFDLVGPHQCSAALGGPATSTGDLYGTKKGL